MSSQCRRRKPVGSLYPLLSIDRKVSWDNSTSDDEIVIIRGQLTILIDLNCISTEWMANQTSSVRHVTMPLHRQRESFGRKGGGMLTC